MLSLFLITFCAMMIIRFYFYQKIQFNHANNHMIEQRKYDELARKFNSLTEKQKDDFFLELEEDIKKMNRQF